MKHRLGAVLGGLKVSSAAWHTAAVQLAMTGMAVGALAVGSVTLSACASASGGGQDVMTPQERIAEEEKLAYEAEQRQRQREKEGTGPVVEDEPQKSAFDEKQSEMELKRATRSAESCTGVVREAKERGEATVMITFSNEGAVQKAEINSPFDGTPLGECVLNAYKAVIVPPYDGELKTVKWDLELKDPPADPDAKSKKTGAKK